MSVLSNISTGGGISFTSLYLESVFHFVQKIKLGQISLTTHGLCIMYAPGCIC